jgi:DNA-binding response OmpR family regulator
MNTQEPKPSILSKRVLIADNNRSKYNELIAALNEAGIETFHVDHRQKIVEKAMQIQPDLILVNLFMSSGNTLPTIREVRGVLERQGTKILVVTSHQSRENIAECIRNGASDFIIEPFDSRQLLQRVRYQLQDRETYSPDDLRAEPTQVLAGFQLVYDTLRILAELKDSNKAVFEALKKIQELSVSTRVNLIMADIESPQAAVIGSSDDASLNHHLVDLEKYPEVREVLLRGSIVYIKDITTNPLTRAIKDKVKSIEIHSLLVLPVRHRGETIGTLNIRLGANGLAVSDKHLKTFYMVALALAPKVAARKLLKKMSQTTA